MSSSIEQQYPDALRNKVFHLRIELFWHRVVVAVSAEVVPMLALEVVLRNFNFHAGDEDAVGCLFGVHVAAALRIVAELISRRIGLPVSLRAAGVSGGVSAELQDGFDVVLFSVRQIEGALPYRFHIQQTFRDPHVVDKASGRCPILNGNFRCREAGPHRVELDAADGSRIPCEQCLFNFLG